MTLSEQVFTPARRDDDVPVLATARLVLRAPRRSDIKAIATLANDLRVAANTARIPHPYAIEDAEQFITSVNKREGEACFAVTLDGAPIGVCSVDLREDGPEMGYWLGVPYWGRGLATEAVRALIDHAFGDLEHETLISGARVNNPASRRVLEKCGFQWISVRLSRIRAINSAAPIDRFRLDRGLWASLKSWGHVSRAV
jgi:RimJ/RimL family protein N-acetyltransferase